MHFDRNYFTRGPKSLNIFEFGIFIGRFQSDGTAAMVVKGLRSHAHRSVRDRTPTKTRGTENTQIPRSCNTGKSTSARLGDEQIKLKADIMIIMLIKRYSLTSSERCALTSHDENHINNNNNT